MTLGGRQYSFGENGFYNSFYVLGQVTRHNSFVLYELDGKAIYATRQDAEIARQEAIRKFCGDDQSVIQVIPLKFDRTAYK